MIRLDSPLPCLKHLASRSQLLLSLFTVAHVSHVAQAQRLLDSSSWESSNSAGRSLVRDDQGSATGTNITNFSRFFSGNASFNKPTFEIDWSQVPAGASSGPSFSKPVVGLGACMCDLVAGGCDTNCCCDPDCDSVEKQLFSGCVATSPPAPSLQFCVPDSAVARVNLRNSRALGVVEVSPPAAGFLEKQLCIVHNNNPSLGLFFDDPPNPTANQLSAAIASGLPSASFTTSDNGPPPSPSSAPTFKANDSIPAAYEIGSALVPAGLGRLALPSGALSAHCEPALVVGFLMDVEPQECQIPMTEDLLQNHCSYALSTKFYIDMLKVGKSTLSRPLFHHDGFVGVTLKQLSYRDARSRTLMPRNLIVAPRPSNSSSGNGTSTTQTQLLPVTRYDTATHTCMDALIKADFRIVHDGRGAIVRVEVAAVVTDIVATLLRSSSSSSQTAPPVTVTQQFSLSFVRDGTEASQLRPKSGNPGYITGMPVLAGALRAMDNKDDNSLTSKQAIAQYVDGLPLPTADPSSGLCSTALSAVRALTFGVSQVSTCSIALTLAELRAFCQGRGGSNIGQEVAPPSTPPLSSQLLGGLFDPSRSKNNATTYVGQWGNAAGENVGDWVPVEVAPVANSMVWSEAARSCSGVPCSMRLAIATARVGSSSNPQHKIVGVRLSWGYGTWAFMQQQPPSAAGSSSSNNNNSSSSDSDARTLDAQRFTLTHVASFLPITQGEPKGKAPRPPPLFPSLPDNIFYPFYMRSTAAAPARRPTLWTHVFCPIAFILALHHHHRLMLA